MLLGTRSLLSSPLIPILLDRASSKEAGRDIHVFGTESVSLVLVPSGLRVENIPQILANILAQTIQSGTSIVASIQVIMKQEVHLDHVSVRRSLQP